MNVTIVTREGRDEHAWVMLGSGLKSEALNSAQRLRRNLRGLCGEMWWIGEGTKGGGRIFLEGIIIWTLLLFHGQIKKKS